jgi:hypothetical protein
MAGNLPKILKISLLYFELLVIQKIRKNNKWSQFYAL